MDSAMWPLLGRLLLINVLPFILVFHLVMQRRKQAAGLPKSEITLVAGELITVGVLGYVVILSLFFFSIPVLRHLHPEPGYAIYLIPPEDTTVFLIAFVSYALVVTGIYLGQRRRWAYYGSSALVSVLLVRSFFAVLEIGITSIVPVMLFAYVLFRLTRSELKNELYS